MYVLNKICVSSYSIFQTVFFCQRPVIVFKVSTTSAIQYCYIDATYFIYLDYRVQKAIKRKIKSLMHGSVLSQLSVLNTDGFNMFQVSWSLLLPQKHINLISMHFCTVCAPKKSYEHWSSYKVRALDQKDPVSPP